MLEIMPPIGELHKIHARVRLRITVDLEMRLPAALLHIRYVRRPVALTDIGCAVDEESYRLAETGFDIIERRRRVFDRVVQESGRDGVGICAEIVDEGLRDSDRVCDERFARDAALRRMARSRVFERLFDEQPFLLREPFEPR